MKLSANEEYGLRCLVRIGYAGKAGSLTIPEMSRAEASPRPTPPRSCACSARVDS